MTIEQKPGYCTLCRSRCGTLNTIENGRLVKVAPLPGHPTGQAICAKGRAAPEIADGSNRLLHPMRRTRPKTDPDPGWERIGWEPALDIIAQRLLAYRDSHGAESVAFALSSPSGTALTDSYDWIERLVWLYGSPNVCNATEICNWPKDFAHRFTFGHGMPPPDYARSDVIMLWGFNPAVSWLAHASAIGDALARGAELIVVDPRKAGFANQATEWLAIKPGTDGLLALGLAHLLISSKRFDEAFVRSWTTAPFLVRADTGAYLRWRDLAAEWHDHASGERPHAYVAWDEIDGQPVACDPGAPMSAEQSRRLALHGACSIDIAGTPVECRPAFALYAELCASTPLEEISRLTGLPIDAMERTATAIQAGKRTSYHCWTGVSQHDHATQTERAIALLYALTGSFDAHGGNLVLNRQPINRINLYSLLPAAQQRKALGLAQRPLGPPASGWITATDLYTAILESEPYPVKALIAFGSNILASLAEPLRGRQALQALEFQVHCDLYETPTMQSADIILPINSAWEREGLRVGFENSEAAEELIQLRPQMMASRGEARSDAWVVFELAKRLGLTEAFFGGSLDAGWDHMLAPLCLTVAELRQKPAGIRRPMAQHPAKYAALNSGSPTGFPTPSRRVEIYAEQLLRHGQSPLPRFATPPSTAYPLVLTTARNSNYCHSQHRAIASLRKRADAPMVEIGEAVAHQHCIRSGDWVVIETPVARARFRARVTSSMNAETVVAEYGWWEGCAVLGLPGYEIFGDTGSNYNGLLAADTLDPVTGAPAMRSTQCQIRPLRDAASQSTPPPDRSPQDWLPLQVARVKAEAEGVVTITLRSTRAEPLPAFDPGQHIIVRPPEEGALIRTYSLSGASCGDQPEEYRITVKRSDAAGPTSLSRHIATTLKPGDTLLVQSPRGGFRLPRNLRQPIVMMAAGIGITPFISYLATAHSAAPGVPVLLYYGNRNRRSHAFRSELSRLARELPWLRVVNYYSRPDPADRLGTDYDVAGRLDAAAVGAEWIEDRAVFYLCGPRDMMRDITSGLIERGVRPFEIFQEAFQAPAVPITGDVSASFTVRLAASGGEFVWTPACGSILDGALAAGLPLPGGCRSGYCGNCALKLLSGGVRHLIESDDHPADTCLTCQSVPVSDLTLQL